MIGSWLWYAVVVSAGVSVAGWLAERGLRAQGWPTRPAWVAALLVSAGAPMVAWLVPSSSPAPLAAVPGAYVLEGLPRVVAGASSGPSLEALLLAGWTLATGLLLATVIVLAARLWLRLRRWPTRVVDGVEVQVSRRTGPAALGMVRGRVVVPEWVLELEPRQRALLLLHESEHVRARDPQLALVGLLICVIAPWNLPLWWQLRRLRLAIEVDCDARVLERAGDARGYGSLLLAVGQRRARLSLALAEPRSMLERRIRMITKKRSGWAWVQAAALLALAGVALVVACETPSPTDSPEAAEALVPEDGAGAAAQDAVGVIKERVAGAEEGGLGCAQFTIDGEAATAEQVKALAAGQIRRIDVVKGEAAVAAGGEASCGVVRVTTGALEPTRESSYEARAATERQQVAERAARARAGADPPAEATFTPMTQPPQLRDAEGVGELLRERYPPLLRDAGIGGTANVWFYIDETGTVARAQIRESSGYEALDQAALSVAREMTFTPARNGEETVAVWVALDIQFENQ